MIKAVCFDLWNTLIYCPTKDRLNEIISLLGLEGRTDYRRIIEDAEKTMFKDSSVNDRKFFEWLCAEHNVKKGVEDIDSAVRIWESRLNGVKLFPEAMEVIGKLGEKHKLALVSNIEGSGVKYMREKQGELLKHFDEVIMSCEVGLAKPDERIFKLACRKLKTKPPETMMVGDYPRIDYDGALKAGLKAVLVDRNGIYGEGFKKIKSLRDLEELIANER